MNQQDERDHEEEKFNQELMREESASELGLQEMTEALYNLDREELRRLAWEALLISDGPHKVEDSTDASASEHNSCFLVVLMQKRIGWANDGFSIAGKKGWTA